MSYQIDGNVVDTDDIPFAPHYPNRYLYAFGCNTSSYYPSRKGLRIYELLWYNEDNTTLYKHFVPARRRRDGVLGFYDKVNNAFVEPRLEEYREKFIAGKTIL